MTKDNTGIFRGYYLNNEKGIASMLNIPLDLNVIRDLFETDNLLIPKYYTEKGAYRVVCKERPSSKEAPSAFTNNNEVLLRGPILIFGMDSVGSMISLTESEVEWFKKHTYLGPSFEGLYAKLGNYIKPMERKLYIKLWVDDSRVETDPKAIHYQNPNGLDPDIEVEGGD